MKMTVLLSMKRLLEDEFDEDGSSAVKRRRMNR
jgi:hypothetical protein